MSTVINYKDIEYPEFKEMTKDIVMRHLMTKHNEKEIKFDMPSHDVEIVKGSILVSRVGWYDITLHLNDAGNDYDIVLKDHAGTETREFDDIMKQAPEWHKHWNEAITNIDKDFRSLAVGNYVFGAIGCNKLNDVDEYLEEMLDRVYQPSLLHIEHIYDMTDKELMEMDFLASNSAPCEFNGGSFSEDIPDDMVEMSYSQMPYAQRKSYIDRVCMIRTPNKCVFVDPEGYDYCRYVYLPLNWRTMYANEIASVKAKLDDAKRKADEEKAAQRAKLDAEYKEREEWVLNGIKNLSPIKDNYDRRGRINNIKRILSHHFPGTKFSVSFSYKHDWDYIDIEWEGAPSKEELQKVTDAMRGDRYPNEAKTYDGYTCDAFYHNNVTKYTGLCKFYYKKITYKQ